MGKSKKQNLNWMEEAQRYGTMTLFSPSTKVQRIYTFLVHIPGRWAWIQQLFVRACQAHLSQYPSLETS